MTKEIIAFSVPDISALAKLLKKDFEKSQSLSHVEILNSLARASGFKNFQHLKANGDTTETKEVPFIEPSKDILSKINRYFDGNLILIRWPKKESLRILCLWFLWSRIADNAEFTEISFNKILNGLHSFGDAALLRRYLYENGFISRSLDCKDYKKIAKIIPDEYLPIINWQSKDNQKPVKKLKEVII